MTHTARDPKRRAKRIVLAHVPIVLADNNVEFHSDDFLVAALNLDAGSNIDHATCSIADCVDDLPTTVAVHD